jgi:hypothetical protein
MSYDKMKNNFDIAKEESAGGLKGDHAGNLSLDLPADRLRSSQSGSRRRNRPGTAATPFFARS